MDNNSSGQRATPACRQDRHNGQRNSYPQRDAHRSWHGERQSPVEDQQRGQEDRSGETINAPHQGGPQKTFKTFRDLAVWQKGISLAKTVYQKTGSFPKEELYGLVTQMREAAGGVPAKTRHGISTVPQRCFGFPRRAGNSRCSCRRAELFISGEQRGPLGGTGPSGKNDDQLMQQGSTLTVAPVLPTGRRCALRYRLDILSSRSCPHAASTSRPAVLRNIERTPDISSV